uniref:hypothetical protein n=1 Tax=Paractinoplanes polyasparticus TaxID=2856853 RepID=UPI001C85BF7C|nr:hypothetical protein [Actinoplanes polyasparticus]
MDEPADNSHVAVAPFGEPDLVRVYRRRDEWADHNYLGGEHWFSRTDHMERAKSWNELTTMGAVAVVGEFVGGA